MIHARVPQSIIKKGRVARLKFISLISIDLLVQLVSVALAVTTTIVNDSLQASDVGIYLPHDGSMYAMYGNIYHQYTPFMLVYIYIYQHQLDPSWVHDFSGLVPEFDSLNQWDPKI